VRFSQFHSSFSQLIVSATSQILRVCQCCDGDYQHGENPTIRTYLAVCAGVRLLSSGAKKSKRESATKRESKLHHEKRTDVTVTPSQACRNSFPIGIYAVPLASKGSRNSRTGHPIGGARDAVLLPPKYREDLCLGSVL
jgi:hypothetical protein